MRTSKGIEVKIDASMLDGITTTEEGITIRQEELTYCIYHNMCTDRIENNRCNQCYNNIQLKNYFKPIDNRKHIGYKFIDETGYKLLDDVEYR